MKTKSVFKINGMDCSVCTLDLDGNIENIDGVIESKTSYAKQQTEVIYDPKKVTHTQILTIIQNTGYTASS